MSIRIRLKTIIGVLFLMVIGNSFFSYMIDHFGEQKLEWVNHTHEVIIQTERYLSALQDTETGQRGYLLTQNLLYLEPYTNGLVYAKESFEKLSSLVSDNPAQLKQLDSIKALMELKFSELKDTILLMQDTENLNKALGIVRQNKGKQYMDAIRERIRQFVNVEMVLLEKRKSEYREYKAIISTVIIIEIIFFMFMGMLTVSFLNKNLFEPLNTLLLSTKKMESGKRLDISDITPKHELGYLLNSFFRMNEKVFHRTQRLDYKAHHDELTGLYNRTNLLDEVKKAIKNSNESNTKLAVLFLDLDKFKQLNDTLGHDSGDAMLKETAKRLKNVTRSDDLVFRVGGDEFVCIFKNITDISSVESVASHTLDAFQPPMTIQGRSIDIFISIGVAIAPDNSEDPEKLLKMSDVAMYASKQHKESCYKLFDKGMLRRSVDKD